MNKHGLEATSTPATFGRRKVTPRVCIADAKQHVRTFLSETFQEFGFVTCECAQASELAAVLEQELPDLVVIGLSAGGVEAGEIVKRLAAAQFDGKALLLGPADSLVVAAVQELGGQLGVAMLPALATPFRSEDLRNSVGALLPAEVPPAPPVDVAEALHAGWLELWYQPKVDVGVLALSGAEAGGLCRRHISYRMTATPTSARCPNS